jgi:hypothetical protein
MEQHSLYGDGAAERRWFPRDGQKSGKHVCEKRLSPKNGHQKNTPPKTTLFSHIFPFFTLFLLLFIFRSIMVAT